MSPRLAGWLSLLSVVLAGVAAAQSSAVLNYQGRVSVDGTNFDGSAYFVFSIHDTNGVILWSSGSFPVSGTTNLPAGVWRLGVRDGLYNVRLGDRAAGMPVLDATSLNSAAAPFLRVWFNDGVKGWKQLAGDAPLKATLQSAATSANASGATLTTAQGETILKELRELRSLVQSQPAAQPNKAAPATPQVVTVPLGDSPSLGKATAPLVLVEFTDFQCPFCRRAHDDLIPTLKKKFVETGKLRFVSRSLPLDFHANAEPAALAALCAGQQKQFWAMYDRLFAFSTNLATTNILQAAADLKLDIEAFNACFEKKATIAQIARDKNDAGAAGITGTPTFVLGRVTGDKVTGTLMIGARPAAVFESEIEKLLAAK